MSLTGPEFSREKSIHQDTTGSASDGNPSAPTKKMKTGTPLKSHAIAVALAGGLLIAQPGSAAFVVDSLNGDITSNEINNFISTVSGIAAPISNYGDGLSTHATTVEGIRRMYLATGNTA